MKKIIFLVGNYYPRAMANGICVGAIAEELDRNKCEVHVICQKFGNELDDEVINGVFVHRIKPSLYKTVELLRGTHGQSNHVFLKAVSLLIKLLHIPFYPVTSFLQIHRYKKKLFEIGKMEHYTVVSCFNPMEAVVAGMKVKRRNSNITSIGYYLDSLSNEGDVGIIPKQLRDYLGYKWEQKLFLYSDAILLMEGHRRHYLSCEYKAYHEKMRFVDVPLFIENEIEGTNESKKVVYAGMLSKERRNPEYACRILSEALPDYSIEFYGRGNCDAILEQFSANRGGNVVNKGFVGHNEAMRAIQSAGVLLSIGNKDSDMIPSKIFEYISTGKKIVHFAYDKRDACIPYLNKYPNGLLINMYEDRSINITKCRAFFGTRMTVDYQNVKLYFEKNTPKYTAEIIRKYVE